MPRQGAVDLSPGEPFQIAQTGRQQVEVSAELVDDKPGDQSLVLGRQQGDRAQEGGEHPAAVDITDDDRRQSRMTGQPHIDVIACAQIDFGRAAGPLRDHDVVAGGEVVEGLVCRLGERPSPLKPVRRRQLAPGPAHQHDVAAVVAARLEQDRIHGRLGRRPGRECLHPLGATDLHARAVGAVGRTDADHRVVGHVLGFERRYPHPAPGQRTAKTGGDGALTGVTGGTGHQQTRHQPCLSRKRSIVQADAT